MPRSLLHRRLILGLLASTLLVACVWAVPSLCQAPPRGYARLLASRTAVAPDAVTDCRMTAIRLRGACGPDAAIPDEAFASLRDQCRQAAKAGTAGQRVARM